MTCGRCQTGNPDNAKFCLNCGAPLGAVCPQCGGELAPGAKFCHHCGHSLAVPQASAPPAPLPVDPARARLEQYIPRELLTKLEVARATRSVEGERRIVTILFCDVQGSTAMAEQLDPEEWAEIMNGAFAHLIAPVYRYEGTLARLMGDAILAFFGAPIAHEDDPRRAVLAGLDILQGIQGYRERVKREWGGEINVRVGINTGLVVVGEVGSDLRVEYTAMGDAVNLAARMEQTATPGTVQISGNTYTLVKTLFDCESLGDIQIKGKAHPVAAYRVLGKLAAPRPARGLESYGLSTPLVGRDDELRELLAIFDRMLRGHTQVVSIIGEAGAGKSRLLREFLSRLEMQGRLDESAAHVWSAACSSLGEQPYGVFAGFFAHAYGVIRGDSPAVAERKLRAAFRALGASEEEVERALPLVGHVLGIEQAGAGLPAVEPEQIQRQLFLAVRSLVELHLQQGPLLLVAEDLHWADAASIELLRFLADRLENARLLVLLTHRPPSDSGSLPTDLPAYTALRLAPLPADEVQALLDAYFGTASARIPDGARKLIVERAGGNPFYAEEIVRGLIEAGTLKHEADSWIWTANVTTLDVPATVQGVLLARLDRLPPVTLRFAQEAAVLGPAFDETVLREVCSDPASMEAYLDDLYRVRLVEQIPRTSRANGHAELRYRFTHILIQEVAYESLLLRRRTEMHGHVAETLEELCRGRPGRLEDLEALGHHYSLSANKLKGARYLIAAGDWARNLYANEDAARYYRRALGALSKCDQPECWTERRTAHERLGDVQLLTGEFAEAEQSFRRAREGEADLARRVELWCKEGSTWEKRGEYGRALAAFQAAEDEVQAQETAQPAAALARPRAELELSRGLVYHRQGDDRRTEVAAEHALALLEEEESDAIVNATYLLATAAWRRGDPARAETFLRRGLAMAEQLGNRSRLAACYSGLGQIAVNRGDYAEADACEQRALEIYRQVGDQFRVAVSWNNLGVSAFERGDYTRAEECYRRSLAIREPMGDQGGLAVSWANLGEVAQHRGEYAGAEEHYLRSLALYQQIGDQFGIAYLHHNLGRLAHLRGRLEQAEEHYRQSLVIRKQIDYQEGLAESMTALGELHLERGEMDMAIQQCRRARRLARRIGAPEAEAWAAVGLGRAYLRAGTLRHAACLVEHARSLAAAHDLVPAAVHSRLLLAELRLVQERPSEARDAAEDALSLARDRQMRLEEAIALRLRGESELAGGNRSAGEVDLSASLGMLEAIGAELELARARATLEALQSSPTYGRE